MDIKIETKEQKGYENYESRICKLIWKIKQKVAKYKKEMFEACSKSFKLSTGLKQLMHDVMANYIFIYLLFMRILLKRLLALKTKFPGVLQISILKNRSYVIGIFIAFILCQKYNQYYLALFRENEKKDYSKPYTG